LPTFHSKPECIFSGKADLLSLPIITAGAKTVQKGASLTVIAVLTIFALNLVEVGQSTHTCRFLMIWIGIAGGMLMSPSAMASFSVWSDT
jgi:hypothetical protein